jgi:NAD(P)-dependent dehydrogenase (short-subunit alcohol dehydrogenase family)
MAAALKPIDQQVVVITGASSGIGRDAALRFAARGSAVVLAARDAAALDELEKRIAGDGGRALAVPADVCRPEQVEALAARTADAFGGIDTWINNAAVAMYGTFEETPVEDFRHQVDVNFFGQVYGARAALPHLRTRGGGVLMFVGSALSDRAIPLQSGYCAAKHALKSFTESLRVELQHSGADIQVTLIKPASINTPFFDYALTRTGFRPRPVSPVYPTRIVSDALLWCAEHREREFAVGGFAKGLCTLETFAGSLLDSYLVRSGFRGQMTDERKSAEAPSNLYLHVDGGRSASGGFPERHFSAYTWLRRHPPAMRAIAAASVVALARGLRGLRA